MGTHDSIDDPRNAAVLVYINGDFVPREQAKISVFDGGYLTGDGVWEGLRLHNGSLVFLDRHLDRLLDGAQRIGLDLGMTRDEIAAAMRATVEVNGMDTDVHVRAMFTRGTKRHPFQSPDLVIGGPNVVIIAEHNVAHLDLRVRGMCLATSTVRRPPPDTLDQRLNTHSKLHEVMALNEAYAAGADEALMLDTTGAVATCNSTHFFMVRNGEVWTSTGEHCLRGITRAVVIELCEQNNVPIHQAPFSVEDVYAADEAFVTGSHGGLTPVVALDGHAIGSGGLGPMTQQLTTWYKAAVEADTRRAG